jgi:hypothetical protein
VPISYGTDPRPAVHAARAISTRCVILMAFAILAHCSESVHVIVCCGMILMDRNGCSLNQRFEQSSTVTS